MPVTMETVRAWGIGGLIALIVLVVGIVLLCIGQTLTPTMLLVAIIALALARLT